MAAATVRTQLAAVSIAATRISSLDIVRGAVMVLMAIDHVRVYSGVPAGGPTYGVFFTRWVTHFCAPAFIFLAGTAAYLHGRKLGDRGALSRWLALRGAWLVLLELTVLRFAWTFNVDYAGFTFAGVIVPAQTLLQKETPHALMGRISSTTMSVVLFAQLIGLALSGVLANAFGVRAVFFLCAALAWVLTGAGKWLLGTERHAVAI